MLPLGGSDLLRSLLPRDRRFARRPFALADFRPIEAGTTTSMMRHAFPRRVENALAHFGVIGKGRKRDALD